MKKVYLLLFVGIIAVIAIIFILMNYDSKTDTWSSWFLGGAVGFLVVGTPSIIAWFKKKKQNTAK